MVDTARPRLEGGSARSYFASRPPIHDVGVETNGTSFLRWFLHRIWPYPTFLTDIHWTATRIGVTAEWLGVEITKQSEVSALLNSCLYSGAFSKFGSLRWWRAGIADVVATIANGQPFSREALEAGLVQLSSGKPEFLLVDDPVLAVDPIGMEATRVVDARIAVQDLPGWLACLRRLSLGYF